MESKQFLGKRRDRAIATLLSFKEREVDPHLPEDVAIRLRKTILDQFNDVCDLAFDLLAADQVLNEAFLDRLDGIETAVREFSGGSNQTD